MTKVENHHWENAQFWAKMEGDPLEVAQRLVRLWNEGTGTIEGYPYIMYPTTLEFYTAIAEIIHLARLTEIPELVKDGTGDILCDACRQRKC